MRTRRKNKSGDEIRWVEGGFFNRVVIILASYEERAVIQSAMVGVADMNHMRWMESSL